VGAFLPANRSLAALVRAAAKVIPMTNPQGQKPTLLSSLMNSLSGLPISDLVSWLYKLVLKILNANRLDGMYEVLEYESTLELKDAKGVTACFKKREKVRYLQDHIIAYQDQAWGDGSILLNYRSTPGKAVDFYRPGNKTYIVISIQNVRNRGDQDEYFIEWEMKDCFLRDQELWETSVNHPTRNLKINIVFPKKRPPTQMNLIEDTRQNVSPLSNENIFRLPDGRWRLHWETARVRQNERYILQWEW
jgi:hypothetical protein